MNFKIVNFLFVSAFRCYNFIGIFNSFWIMYFSAELVNFDKKPETSIEICYQTTHHCACVF